MARTQAKATTDHKEIRRWVEERGGKPAAVRNTESDGDAGVLRIRFREASRSNDAELEEITWDEWFDKFDRNNLALLYQEQTAQGHKSFFNNLVSRHTVDEVEQAVGGQSRSASRRSPSRKTSTPGEPSQDARFNARSDGSRLGKPGTQSSARNPPRNPGASSRPTDSRDITASGGRPQMAMKSKSARSRSSSTGRASTRNRAAESPASSPV
jgi:hypothetical protein